MYAREVLFSLLWEIERKIPGQEIRESKCLNRALKFV